MPLPPSDTTTVWPPPTLDPILTKMRQWSAWYSGDLEKLAVAYTPGGSAHDTTGFFASDTGGWKPNGRGAIGAIQRWFVGEKPSTPAKSTKLPIPIAAELCQASADLLFSDPVTITSTDPSTQERLDELIDGGVHSTFAAAAELCAALGGVYLRVTWDTSVVADAPFITIVDADQVVPEFKWGHLIAATIWSVIKREGKHVWRHLERHELRDGVGVVLHGLYMGEETKLGLRVSLSTLPETMSLDTNSSEPGMIDTLSEELAIIYVPNQTPNRNWRTHPLGRNLGRSDLDGVEHLMDQLAETMSDWMRARRAARARIMVGKGLVKNAGPGAGAVVDLDQEVYVTAEISGSGGKDTPLNQQVQVLQPTFDPKGYQVTVKELVEQIVQMAGYSVQTVAATEIYGSPRTATEVDSKDRRSLMTAARKKREWVPALEQLLSKFLAVDGQMFGHLNQLTELRIEFPSGAKETQVSMAKTVLDGYQSESMSTAQRVAHLHPDWEQDQIDEETALIRAEFSLTVPDPMMTPFDLTNAGPTATA